MAIFCTRCGAANDAAAAFCNDCGAPLRAGTQHAPVPPPPFNSYLGNDGLAGATSRQRPGLPKPLMWAGAVVLAMLLVGSVVAYVMRQPPAATSSALLAAAKAGNNTSITRVAQRELCLQNADYSDAVFEADPDDTDAQAWFNTLVAAGLYQPPTPAKSGGLFARNVLQYEATPELQKYRKGSALCLAKGLEIADVSEIRQLPPLVGADPANAKVSVVQAKVIFKSTDLAPWMQTEAVRDTVMPYISGWSYAGGQLIYEQQEVFGLQDNQWTSRASFIGKLPKVASEEVSDSVSMGDDDEQEVDTDEADEAEESGEDFHTDRPDEEDIQFSGRTPPPAALTGLFGGLSDAWSKLFKVGGHPLQGTWRLDTEGMGEALGMRMPGGLGLEATMTFTSNTMEVAGNSVPCKFEVDGKRVKVIADGQPISMNFVMIDKNTATMDMGFVQLRYTRVD